MMAHPPEARGRGRTPSEQIKIPRLRAGARPIALENVQGASLSRAGARGLHPRKHTPEHFRSRAGAGATRSAKMMVIATTPLGKTMVMEALQGKCDGGISWRGGIANGLNFFRPGLRKLRPGLSKSRPCGARPRPDPA